MIMSAGKRYSPNNTAALQSKVFAVLTGKWTNIASVCSAIGRRADDGATRYALKLLADRSEIERMTAPSKLSRTGYAFLFRRKP